MRMGNIVQVKNGIGASLRNRYSSDGASTKLRQQATLIANGSLRRAQVLSRKNVPRKRWRNTPIPIAVKVGRYLSRGMNGE
jgi:hypothetical protein